MNTFKRIFYLIIRFLIVWFIDTISLLVTAWIIPGISLQPVGEMPVFVVATAAALLLGIVNLLIRPLLLLITVPLGWMVVFLAGFIINALMLMLASSLMPGFEVSGWWTAFFGGLLLALVNMVLTMILSVDDDETVYVDLQ